MGSKQARARPSRQPRRQEEPGGSHVWTLSQLESLADMFSSELDYTVNSKMLSGVFDR